MTASDKDDRAARLQQAILLKRAGARSRAPELPLRPQAEPAALGEMQRGLWLAHQMAPRSPAYNLASAFRVESPLDVGRLQEALDEVVSRHRLLRSTFRADGDGVRQVVHLHAALGVGTIAARKGGVRAAAIREAREPFDLENGPLVRLQVVEETPGPERLLLLVLHHILADERSLGFLWKELAEAYEGRLSGPAPQVQHDDYVHWLRSTSGEARAREIAYWRQRLHPLPDELRLPFERSAEGGAGEGRLLSRRLGPADQQGLRRLAAATGGTPFAASAFAFRLLLHRYTQGERTAFATPVSTRSHPATASMIGYFLNPVVVSTPLDEGQRVGEAVREFGRDLREILAHASVPFDVLAEQLSPRRQRDRHPVFQSMFVYQEASPPLSLEGAPLEPVTLDLGGSKFDLTLFVTESEGALEIAVEYRADRFDEIWMCQLLDHYQTLLEHLPGGLESPVSEVAMLGAEEESRLRTDARGAALQAPGPALLPQQILDQARRQPGALAVTCRGDRRSYRELEGAACSIAAELSARGVGPGDRIGLFLDRSVGMVAGALGCHRAGAAYVPLDPAYPAARNRDVLEDAAVAAVLTTAALRGRLPAGQWPVIDTEALGDDGRAELPLPDLSPDSPAYLLYTSGSTGRPKGVVVTHGNLRASTAARRQAYDAPPGRFLLVPSVAFDSSVAGLFGTLAAGGTLVVPTDDEVLEPRRLAGLVRQERVSALLCVPSLYAQMLASGADRLGGLEAAIVAGESCSSGLAEEHFRVLPQVRLFNEYGPTEATVWATVHEVTEEDAARPVAIGRPIPGVRVDVLDALGRPVPAGIPGEAWIAGPTVAEGYWRRPDLTRERFVTSEGLGGRERRYRTGDRMAWTPEGRLLFLGRVDEQIKLRGFRIEPGEVEAALLEHPAIEQATVVARGLGPDATAAPEALRLVAFVEAAGAVVGWREGLAERLPDHMIPSRLVEIDELPRLPNGKVDRRRLRERALDAESVVGSEDRVLDTREQALVSLWEGLLCRSGIRPTDNFFELGGHSLLVVEMTSAIARDFEVTLSAADVFESPTVSGLARRIEQQGGSRNPPYHHLFPIQPGGHRTPLIVAVPHFFTGMLAMRFRGERPVYGLRGVGLRPEGNRGRWRTMAALAEELVAEIRRRFPDEDLVMAGYSFGASMAIEAVRVMEERRMPVRRLYVVAPMPLDGYRLGPLRLQIDGLDRSGDQLSAGEALRRYARANHPFTRGPYRRAWRWLAIEPWRRLLCRVGQLRSLAGRPLTPRILHADVRVERFRLHAQYRPGIVRTPTVFFNAQGTTTDAAATWRPFFQGPFTVVETPDPHDHESVEAARQVILDHLKDMGDA